MRLVLDTDVVVAAMRSPTGASAAILQRLRVGGVICLIGVALALEYEAICSKDVHREASGLTAPEVDIFVRTVIALMEPVRSHYLWRPQLRDAGDELVLEVAINGQADMLVTFNARDFVGAGRFGIKVVSPGEALARLTQ